MSQAKLNSVYFQLAFKTGLAANIGATSTKNLAVIGEPAFTTDTKEVYIFDGTSFISVVENVPTYERHKQLAAELRGTPADQPTQVTFFTVSGLQFPTTGTKYAYCEWEIPDDWDGGDVYMEVDWFPDSGAMTGTDTIKWNVEYRAIAESENVNNGTSVTLSTTDSDDHAQYEMKHARHTLAFNSANQPLTAQDHIYFKISRDTSVANDFGGTVTVPAFGIVYNSVKIPTN